MKTVTETTTYRIEWHGTDGGKNWIFTDLNSAKEIYQEKNSEGKKPKLFVIHEKVTKDETRIAV